MSLNSKKAIVIFIIISIVLSFTAVALFTQPAFIEFFNLSDSKTSNIGGTIGGITAPVIGLISAFLLFQTLNRQIDAINQQRKKNESDLIFSLINQLNVDISYFYHTEKYKPKGEPPSELRYTGMEAFHKFVHLIIHDLNLATYKHSLYSFYETKQLLQFLRSFLIIEDKINDPESDLDKKQKDVFLEKINTIYNCLFKESLKNLISKLEKYENMKDEAFEEITTFVKNH